MFRVNRSLPDAAALGAIGQLVPALEWAFSRIEAGDEAGIDHSSYMMIVLLLAFCHELLGKTQAAVDYLTKGLQVDPYNDALLGAEVRCCTAQLRERSPIWKWRSRMVPTRSGRTFSWLTIT